MQHPLTKVRQDPEGERLYVQLHARIHKLYREVDHILADLTDLYVHFHERPVNETTSD